MTPSRFGTPRADAARGAGPSPAAPEPAAPEPAETPSAGADAGTGPPPERRGRPRSAAVDTAVVETVLRMLEEGATIAELSIERIARGAGVGKATLYRRWPGKNALMLDVIQRLEVPDPPFPGTSLRADLITAVESVRRRGLAKRSSALLRNVLAQAQQDPELWRAYYEGAIAARRAQLRAALVRGIERGEITTGLDLDMLGDMVSGPMLYRAMMRPEAPLDDEGLAARIVDALLDGLRPRAD